MGDWAQTTAWMPRIHSPAADVRFVQELIGRFDVTVAQTWRGAQGFLARDGAEVHALYLAPGARGQGIGARLMNAAKTAAPELALWCFQANEGARRFYAREGFTEVDWTDGAGNDEKLPDVRLIWRRPEDPK